MIVRLRFCRGGVVFVLLLLLVLLYLLRESLIHIYVDCVCLFLLLLVFVMRFLGLYYMSCFSFVYGCFFCICCCCLNWFVLVLSSACVCRFVL